MFDFTSMMREIDAELKEEFKGGAFAWADQTMGNFHKNAVDRFEIAINACTTRCDWASLRVEAEIYKDAMLTILRAFKKSRMMSEQESFLESLKPA